LYGTYLDGLRQTVMQKEITILFCKQIGQSPNMIYTKCRMGLRE
jgi:hypothetical protein